MNNRSNALPLLPLQQTLPRSLRAPHTKTQGQAGRWLGAALMLSLSTAGCARPQAVAAPQLAPEELQQQIATVIDDWHDAAAKADEQRYFGHLSDDAIFMGTDASERWNREAFRAYAKPHFNKGKAWSFKAIRRTIHIETSRLAWFDEDLATPNLGPARGSGVLRAEGTPPRWRIVHYNLSITVPNDRFQAVRKLLSKEPPKLRGR